MALTADNSIRRADVERIVRQVLAELAGRRAAPDRPASGDLVLSGRVVSLAEVEGRLSGVSRVVVERGAVFTPAARDELRQHGVTIASAVRGPAPTGKTTVCLATAETRSDPAPLIAALAGEGVQVDRLADLPNFDAVDELCQRVSSGTLGLLLTGQSAAALCLANRLMGVRAALATNIASVDAAVASIGANLLVIDPAGKSVFEMRQMTRRWLRHGRPECPPGLRQRLG